MISQKQLEANRRNAQRSTGPRTPEGRAAVRSNALRHGLTAQTAVLDNENPQQFQETLDAFQAEYQPVGPTEELLVHQIVMSAWRLQRLRAVETATLNMRLRVLHDEMQNEIPMVNQPMRHAYVFQDDSRNAHTIDKLSRYEARIERSFYKALRELRRLQSTRPPVESVTSPDLPDSANQTHSPNQTSGTGILACAPSPQFQPLTAPESHRMQDITVDTQQHDAPPFITNETALLNLP